MVWIEDSETQEIKHFGTTCATAPAKWFGVEKEIKQALLTFNAKQRALFQLSHGIYRKAGGTYTGNGQDGWKAKPPQGGFFCGLMKKLLTSFGYHVQCSHSINKHRRTKWKNLKSQASTTIRP